jgi:hypothetical protein
MLHSGCSCLIKEPRVVLIMPPPIRATSMFLDDPEGVLAVNFHLP